jgi:hypothetical protein
MKWMSVCLDLRNRDRNSGSVGVMGSEKRLILSNLAKKMGNMDAKKGTCASYTNLDKL